MLPFNKKHPEFDIAMELLATLPPGKENAVPLSTLAIDFGFSSQGPVRSLLDELGERGYLIGTCRADDGRRGNVVYIEPSGWTKARVNATAYMEAVSTEPQSKAA